MENLQDDKVNVIREYKKLYPDCNVKERIQVLSNIQKYQVEMLRVSTMLELEKIRNNSIIDMKTNEDGDLVASDINKKIEVEFTNYKRIEK